MTQFQPQFTITNQITHDLTTIERARGFLDAATLSEQWITRMGQRALLREAHATTHIEGTQLTFEQSSRLWDGEHVADADEDDARELLNYREAFNLVSEYLQGGEPITEALIREIHRKLVQGVRGGTAKPGEYRQIQNYVANSRTGDVVYMPPPSGDVPPLMQELIDWLATDTQIHSVLVSGIAQFQLVHIHPFVDGNGRTSRLLSTLCLYRSGYDFKRLFTISDYYDRDRAAFYRAIQGVRDCGMDLTGWLEFFASGLATQLQETVERGKRVIKTDLLVQEHRLNQRQASIVSELFEKPEISVEELEQILPGVVRRSLQRDLKRLVALEIAVAKGHARATRYSLHSRYL